MVGEPESPYQVPGSEAKLAAHAENMAAMSEADKRRRPDGSIEPDQSVDPATMRAFLESVNAIGAKIEESGVTSFREMDISTGAVREAPSVEAAFTASNEEKIDPPKWQAPTDPADVRALFDKVAAFLDSKTRGPRTIVLVRHKLFVLRLPVAHEMLDSAQLVGVKLGEGMTEAEAMYYHFQVLKKAVMGWLPENSIAAGALRENIMSDEKSWPALNRTEWLTNRDPYWYSHEVGPLYIEFMKWRQKVEPTPEEFDFYFSRVI